MSAGVCKPRSIRLEKQKPMTPRHMLSSKKLMSEVDTMVFILSYSLAPK